jgi:hypothetical protein
MQEVTGEFIRTLAAANGIQLPEERIELVRRQYENLMRSLAVINTLPITRETEPAIGHSLAAPSIAPADGRR